MLSQESIEQVKDFSSLLDFLVDDLDWPIDLDKFRDLNALTFQFTPDELGLENVVKIKEIKQLRPLSGDQPWGFFWVDFEDKRLPIGPLRSILRAFVKKGARGDPQRPVWGLEDILFVCRHAVDDATALTFVRFSRPQDKHRVARLSSFGWTPDSKNRTLLEFNLPPLKWPMDNWRTAFDKEKVTEAFFKEYKEVFYDLWENLQQQTQDRRWAHDYALQLLNRLMFIYFVQRKRTADGKPWLGDDPQFMKTFWGEYQKNGQPKDTFFTHWLKVLFFEAFNEHFHDTAENRQAFPEAIRKALLGAPRLNGGLFTENDLDENFKRRGAKLSDVRFRQIFKFFERYNFTVAEDTPLDQEVAVNPEMLGYVYESLVAERREAGIFYTPRTEIDLMCRLALVDHLANRIGQHYKNLFYEALFAFEQEDIAASDKRIAEENLWPKIDSVLRDITVLDPACGSGSFLVGMLKVLDDLCQRANNALGNDERPFDRRKRIIRESLYGVDIKRFAVDMAELRLWLHLMIETEMKREELTLSPLLPNLSFKVRCGDSLVQEIGGLDLTFVPKQASRDLSTATKGKVTSFKAEKLKFYNNDETRKYRTKQELQQAERTLFLDILSERFTKIQTRIATIESKLTETQATMLSEGQKAKPRSDVAQLTAEKASLMDEMSSIRKAADAISRRTQLPFVWDMAFLEVFEGERRGFDIVIGNPPYVREEKIADPTRKDEGGRMLRKDEGERIKDEKKKYKAKLAKSVYRAFPEYFNYNQRTGKANPALQARNDLYVYFYFHGLSLLNPQGSFCFITSNSWLDVGYGKDLQLFLLQNCPIKMIIDNEAKRSFKHSDVNTIIALFGAPIRRDEGGRMLRKDEGRLSEHVARFVMLKVPFETVLSPVVFEEIEEVQLKDEGGRMKDEARRSTPEYRVHAITHHALLEAGTQAKDKRGKAPQMDDSSFTLHPSSFSSKWGGKYLRAPDIYWTILKKGKGKLVRLGDIADVRRGITTGANEFFYLDDAKIKKWGIEPEFLKPVIKSPRECKRILIDPKDLKYKIFMCHKTKQELAGTAALEYINSGESQGFHERPTCRGRPRWYDLGMWEIPQLLWSDAYNTRFACFENDGQCLADKRFFFITFAEPAPVQFAYINSAIIPLLIELEGILNLGEGVVYTNVYWLKVLPVLSGATEKVNSACSKLYGALRGRKLLPVFEEFNQPDRRALDDVIFDVLGLTRGDRDAVYEAVIDLVEKRLKKARSV